MQQHIKAIKVASAITETNQVKLQKIAEQRAKFAAGRDAAVQVAEALQAKAARAQALAAIGEGDQKAADALAAELAAAEGKVRSLQLAQSGFDEQETQANAAIAQATTDHAVAVRAALDAHLDALAPQYRQAADALVGLHRRLLALYLVRRGLGEQSYCPFVSETEAREFRLPLVNHASFADAPRAGPYSEFVYSAGAEMYMPHEGRMAEAVAAELAQLRALGVPV